MTNDAFSEIQKAFACPGRFLSRQDHGSGHINDTYLTWFECDGTRKAYIHQRVNHSIFGNVPALMENIATVTRHQRKKFIEAGTTDLERRVLTLIPTTSGRDYYQDRHGNFWRCYLFVVDGEAVDVVRTTNQAYEAAKAFGEFQHHLADLDTPLHETIPKFHHSRSRFDTLIAAIDADEHNRAAHVKEEIQFALKREHIVDVVLSQIQAGTIPQRVTHNDTKLNNVLLDAHTGKGLCVIDLDTVMPGSVLYDFGDMVRTMTTQAKEDENEHQKIQMDIVYFEALVEGYLEHAAGFLMPEEIRLLPFSGQLITFETGIRFLTDYLHGDTYFKTHRPRQNIARCRKQFSLLGSMEAQLEAMASIVDKHLPPLG